MARKIRHDHLFTVEKSSFANSHVLFFWVAWVVVSIACIWATPLFCERASTNDGNILNAFFGEIIQPETVALVQSPVFAIICGLLAFVGVVVTVFVIINIKMYKALFFTDRIVIKGGFIARWEKQMPLTPIVGVHMDQSIFGRIFDYASFTVEKVGHDEGSLLSDGKVGELNGPNSILFRVSEASAIKECLEEMIVRTKGEISSIIGNHETANAREGRPAVLKPVR